MLFLIVLASIIGITVGVLTETGLIGLIAGIACFILGLPGLIIHYIFQGLGSDGEEDYRQLLSDIEADERTDRIIEAIRDRDDRPQIYYDNRQIHIHGKDADGIIVQGKEKKKH